MEPPQQCAEIPSGPSQSAYAGRNRLSLSASASSFVPSVLITSLNSSSRITIHDDSFVVVLGIGPAAESTQRHIAADAGQDPAIAEFRETHYRSALAGRGLPHALWYSLMQTIRPMRSSAWWARPLPGNWPARQLPRHKPSNEMLVPSLQHLNGTCGVSHILFPPCVTR